MVFVFIFYFEMKWYRHNKSHVRKIFVLGMSWLGLEHKLSLQYALIKIKVGKWLNSPEEIKEMCIFFGNFKKSG